MAILLGRAGQTIIELVLVLMAFALLLTSLQQALVSVQTQLKNSSKILEERPKR